MLDCSEVQMVLLIVRCIYHWEVRASFTLRLLALVGCIIIVPCADTRWHCDMLSNVLPQDAAVTHQQLNLGYKILVHNPVKVKEKSSIRPYNVVGLAK